MSTAFISHLEHNILTITISRPEKRNSLTMPMLFEFADLIDQASQNDEVRCIVVTSQGDYFCSGADLSEGADVFSSAQSKSSTFDIDETNKNSPGSQIALSLMACTKLIIGAINGPAAGVGATMVLPMDYRLVSENAKVGYVFARRGLLPEAGSSWFLPKIVGMTKACDWMISGRLVEPAELLESGFATAVCKPDELLPKAYAIAKEICTSTSSVSVAFTRQLLWRMLNEPSLAKATAIESAGFLELASGPEAVEGIKSFMEKRPPQFPGKVSKDMPSIYPWW